MNTFSIIAWSAVAFLLMYAATHIRIKRVSYNIADPNCPPEIKERYFREHPGAKWILDMEASFDKVDAHMKEIAMYMKEDKEATVQRINTLEAIQILIVMQLRQELLCNAYKDLVKLRHRADRIIRKLGTKKATEKYFGDYIEDFYYTSFILDEVKGALERKEPIDLNPAKVGACKERAHNIRVEYAA